MRNKGKLCLTYSIFGPKSAINTSVKQLMRAGCGMSHPQLSLIMDPNWKISYDIDDQVCGAKFAAAYPCQKLATPTYLSKISRISQRTDII